MIFSVEGLEIRTKSCYNQCGPALIQQKTTYNTHTVQKKTHQKRYAGHPFFGPFLDSPGEAGRELPRGTSTQQVANEKTKRMQKGMNSASGQRKDEKNAKRNDPKHPKLIQTRPVAQELVSHQSRCLIDFNWKPFATALHR